MSGEWRTGEVVNLCKSYGFIRISKDGKSEDIFFYYGDVKGREPQLGDHVSFELAADAKCRDGKKAVAVEYSRRPRMETRPQTDEATAAGGAAADAPTRRSSGAPSTTARPSSRTSRSRCRRRPSASATKKIKPSARSWRGSGR